jgi:hypothetical protein
MPSSEVANVLPPDPTATSFGFVNVVNGVNPIPKPLVVNVVAPRPVHTMPSGLVAYVLPPCPVAVQKEPFQVILCPLVVKTDVPKPVHKVPLKE